MTTPVPTDTEEIGTQSTAAWEDELGRVGFVRRLLRARRWYGADWWFVVISGVIVAVFIILAAAPGFFAPHGPNEQVGPRFLAPGERPDSTLLVVSPESSVEFLEDLAVGPDAEVRRPAIGVVRGVPTAGALRERAGEIDDALREEASGVRLRPDIQRFDSAEQVVDAIVAGEIQAGVMRTTEFEEVAADRGLVAPSDITGGVAGQGNFILGTNQIGQDLFSRLIWGTRVALLIGFSSALVALVAGVPLGLIAGYMGGKLDRFLTVVMDSLYAFPGLILAIAITAVLGPSVINVIVAIAVLYIPTYYRIVRGQTLAVKEEVYVEAARSIGARSGSILGRYIYPNVIPSVSIIFSVNVADAILTGAGLSFLGLGLPPNIADWGIDIARGREFIQSAWWLVTFPGLAIMLVVLAFTMMGEGLTEILNPKLRDR
jgi:peptide/nickel transport system permease protein